jgi:hypothetical protein
MKTLTTLLLVLVLTGCATRIGGEYKRTLETWIGLPSDRLVTKWGAPTSVYDLGGGGKILTYYETGGTRGFASNGFFQAQQQYCKTDFTVDSQGIVQSWSYNGNACR